MSNVDPIGPFIVNDVYVIDNDINSETKYYFDWSCIVKDIKKIIIDNIDEHYKRLYYKNANNNNEIKQILQKSNKKLNKKFNQLKNLLIRKNTVSLNVYKLFPNVYYYKNIYIITSVNIKQNCTYIKCI
jgi:hypothetical protein